MTTETTTDAFELSTEEFENQKAALMAGEQPIQEEPVQEEPVQEEPVQEEPVQEEPVQEEPVQEEPVQEEPTLTIIHNGEQKKVTQSEAVKLAQMGYDYTAKMQKIAPHRKIAELLDTDEELQKVVNKYIDDKTKIKVKPISDFDTEEEWLEENLKQAREVITTPVKPEMPDEVRSTVDMIVARDPENYKEVLKHIETHARKLTIEEYQEVNTNTEKFLKFYDKVKAEVVGGKPQAAKPKTASPFRVRSSGGPVPRETKKSTNAWDLPGKEFNELLNKVKGY